MTPLQSRKLNKFMDANSNSVKSISRLLTQLKVELDIAIIQQAYARKNPDNNIDAELLAVLGGPVAELMQKYEEVNVKKNDLFAVFTGVITVDEMVAKHPSVNVDNYSKELI